MKKEETRLNVILEPSLLDAVDKYAVANESDRSKVVRLALKKFLQLDPKTKKPEKSLKAS
ncbi:MAG: hypothetical protein O9310_09140 [Leptospiraceae bacterium]|jgi:metal-responsive CopG/Arc/MetJ family transcriptional regulator|nr:hypothetical protein [Leptospiraceae bacterium]